VILYARNYFYNVHTKFIHKINVRIFYWSSFRPHNSFDALQHGFHFLLHQLVRSLIMILDLKQTLSELLLTGTEVLLT
jgi:hypothetical protein